MQSIKLGGANNQTQELVVERQRSYQTHHCNYQVIFKNTFFFALVAAVLFVIFIATLDAAATGFLSFNI